MNKPPIKALESIKNYCEKTQCRRCVFGERETLSFDIYVTCGLQLKNPCDWDLEILEIELTEGH